MYNFEGNHKRRFRLYVDKLIAERIEYRPERQFAVQYLIDKYIEHVGERPDKRELDRLTDYVLDDDLNDPNPHKVSHTEYPFLSEKQLMRRKFGRQGNEDTNMNGEVSLDRAEFVGTDGRDYRYPSRRKRSISELIFVDEHAKIRNRRRAIQYKKDKEPSPVKTEYWGRDSIELYLREEYAHHAHLPWFNNLVKYNDPSTITYTSPPWWNDSL